jgi:glucose-1-phosphate thymidylyltransferase
MSQNQPTNERSQKVATEPEMYLADGLLQVHRMGRGYAWLDTGTHASLLDAGNFVRTLGNPQGLQTGCPEEIAHEAGWITDDQLRARGTVFQECLWRLSVGVNRLLASLLHDI